MLGHIRLSLSILNILLKDREVAGRMSLLESLLPIPSSASSSQHFTTVLTHYHFDRFAAGHVGFQSVKIICQPMEECFSTGMSGIRASLVRSTLLDSLESTLQDAGLMRTILRLMAGPVAA